MAIQYSFLKTLLREGHKVSIAGSCKDVLGEVSYFTV